MDSKTNNELPEELRNLSELMAKNVHEVWMQSRLAEGWTYGLQRNDVLKTHPSIVPYEQLSEEEKDYDRRTSMETLNWIINSGYIICKRDEY